MYVLLNFRSSRDHHWKACVLEIHFHWQSSIVHASLGPGFVWVTNHIPLTISCWTFTVISLFQVQTLHNWTTIFRWLWKIHVSHGLAAGVGIVHIASMISSLSVRKSLYQMVLGYGLPSTTIRCNTRSLIFNAFTEACPQNQHCSGFIEELLIQTFIQSLWQRNKTKKNSCQSA